MGGTLVVFTDFNPPLTEEWFSRNLAPCLIYEREKYLDFHCGGAVGVIVFFCWYGGDNQALVASTWGSPAGGLLYDRNGRSVERDGGALALL